MQLDYDQTAIAAMNTPVIDPIAILSVEAIRSQQNPSANFIPYAFRFDFAVGHLFYSQIDRDISEINDTGKFVEDHLLDFSQAQSGVAGVQNSAEAILVNAVKSSAKYGRSLTYNFATNNCTNQAFALLDDSLKYQSAFDAATFQSKVKTIVSSELPPALSYLKAVLSASSYAITLPEPELTQLSLLSGERLSSALIDGAEKTATPQTYNTWLPMILVPHLEGRHLIRE